MPTELIVLLNAVVMFILSFITDHWIQTTNNPIDDDTLNCTWSVIILDQMVQISCPTKRPTIRRYYSLLNKHGNLYRICTDLQLPTLTENPSSSTGNCIYYLWDDSYHSTISIRIAEQVSLVSAGAAALLITGATIIAIHNIVHKSMYRMIATAFCLSLCALLYAIAIVAFLVKVHLSNHDRQSIEIVQRYTNTSIDWSCAVAIVALIFIIIDAYLYYAKSRSVRSHRRATFRRRQLQSALMSSCRGEVALAIRAKMTVI